VRAIPKRQARLDLVVSEINPAVAGRLPAVVTLLLPSQSLVVSGH